MKVAILDSIAQNVNVRVTLNQDAVVKLVPRDLAGEILDMTGFGTVSIFAAPAQAEKLKFNSSNQAKLATVTGLTNDPDATGIEITLDAASMAALSEDCFDLPMSYYAICGDGADYIIAGFGNLTVDKLIR